MERKEIRQKISKTFSVVFSVIAACIGCWEVPKKPTMLAFMSRNVWIFLWIVSWAVVVGAIVWLLVNLILSDIPVAAYYLWRDGKMRGLYKGDGLIRQLEKCAQKSNRIRIKVTRGYDLLEKDKRYGFWKIFQRLNGNENTDNQVMVQALLMIPCYQERHVRNRYKTHNEKNKISESDFLESWYKFLEAAGGYNHTLKITTRFYFGEHSKWRFYIFSPAEDSTNSENQIVLFSDYDKKKDGRKTPMYKVIKHDYNIGGFLIRDFEEMWKESLTPNQLFESIQHGEIKPRGGYAKGHNCRKCGYHKMCKSFVKKYSKCVVNVNK